jgi:capsular polysaccharide biosynthesis protein
MNEEFVRNEEFIKVEDILYVLMKRWKMILGITLSTVFMVGIISFFVIAPKYEASAKVFIGKEITQDKNYNANDVQMYQRLLKTYAEIITTSDLIEKAIDKENLHITSEKILGNLTVNPRTDTQILEVKYRDTNKEQTSEVVNAVINQFIESSKDLIPNGNVQIIESVKDPEKAVSPNKKLNIAIAFLLGLMISVGLAFLLEFLDNTFKTKEQVEQILGVPVIGTIPDDLN